MVEFVSYQDPRSPLQDMNTIMQIALGSPKKHDVEMQYL